jgi:hypothetical protein
MSVVVLSVDPGKASGIAALRWSGDSDETPEILFSDEIQPEDYADAVLRGLSYREEADTFRVVCERFVINAQTAKNSQAPYSLEQIGILKHLCRINDYAVDSIMFQAPVDAKSMFPNPTLKKIGIWHKGGEGHANDALRHGLLALVRLKWVPSLIID